MRSCTGWGLHSFPGHPGNWCALTAPFHPYPAKARRYPFCCTFLHVAVTPRYGAPCPVVFGLSSGLNTQSGDRLIRTDRKIRNSKLLLNSLVKGSHFRLLAGRLSSFSIAPTVLATCQQPINPIFLIHQSFIYTIKHKSFCSNGGISEVHFPYEVHYTTGAEY